MKIFTNKKIWDKLVIASIIVILFQFSMPKQVQADSYPIGGLLLKPVLDLVVFLGDGAMSLLHKSIMAQSDTLIRIDLNAKDPWWKKVGKFAFRATIGNFTRYRSYS